jgi:hypothetical protein
MKKTIGYFECDDEGDFVVHALVVPDTGERVERVSVGDIQTVVAKLNALVRSVMVPRLNDPVITYAFDGRLMFVIRVSVDYSAATRDAGFSLLQAMVNEGWDLTTNPDRCCHGH